MDRIINTQNRLLKTLSSRNVIWLICALLISSCSGNGDLSDAYGNFEATEIIVSSEANGKVISSTLENGQTLKAGEQVAQIDTVSLYF